MIAEVRRRFHACLRLVGCVVSLEWRSRSVAVEKTAAKNRPAPAEEPWLSVRELAGRLGVCREVVQAMARRKEIPAVRVGRQWRFKLSLVEAALEAPRGRKEVGRG